MKNWSKKLRFKKFYCIIFTMIFLLAGMYSAEIRTDSFFASAEINALPHVPKKIRCIPDTAGCMEELLDTRNAIHFAAAQEDCDDSDKYAALTAFSLIKISFRPAYRFLETQINGLHNQSIAIIMCYVHQQDGQKHRV